MIPTSFPHPVEKNDPSRKGEMASPHKVIFGDCCRYAVYPVHTRFDAVQWFVADAQYRPMGLPEIIRQEQTYTAAVAGLGLSFEAWGRAVDTEICRLKETDTNQVEAPYAEMYLQGLSVAEAVSRSLQ